MAIHVYCNERQMELLKTFLKLGKGGGNGSKGKYRKRTTTETLEAKKKVDLSLRSRLSQGRFAPVAGGKHSVSKLKVKIVRQ